MKNSRLHELAELLFDGNKEKASILIEILGTFNTSEITSPDFINLKMELPEETCKWCIDGECLAYMPDSMFLCKGKCSTYEERLREQDESRN